MILLLAKHGADFCLKSIDNEMPLQIAIKLGNSQMAEAISLASARKTH
jgi:hypothetical protein